MLLRTKSVSVCHWSLSTGSPTGYLLPVNAYKLQNVLGGYGRLSSFFMFLVDFDLFQLFEQIWSRWRVDDCRDNLIRGVMLWPFQFFS